MKTKLLTGLVLLSLGLPTLAFAERESGGRMSPLGYSQGRIQAVLSAITKTNGLRFMIKKIEESDLEETGADYLVTLESGSECVLQGFVIETVPNGTFFPDNAAKPDGIDRKCE